MLAPVTTEELKDLTARCQALLTRAVLTDAALPDVDRRYRSGPHCAMPEPAPDPNFAYGTEGAETRNSRAARFRPTPADVDRHLPVMAWLTWLKRQGPDGARGVKLIVLRAHGHPFWRIAKRLDLGRSDDTARRWHYAAVETVARAFWAEIMAMEK